MKHLRVFGKNKKAVAGASILIFFIIIAIFAPIIAPYSPYETGFKPYDKPSFQNLLGVNNLGQDIFSRLIYGVRVTLIVGFSCGILITIIALIIGISAGYLGGIWDEILSMFTNIFIAIPVIPLILVISAFVLKKGIISVILIITFVSWAWNARIFRSQVLSLKRREYVVASKLIGESNFHIMFKDILPNMLSLIFANFFSTVLFAILAEAAIEFIGLGDTSIISWGTTMYWAYNSQVAILGKWEWLLIPGLCIGLLGISFSLINFGIDEISNPKLSK